MSEENKPEVTEEDVPKKPSKYSSSLDIPNLAKTQLVLYILGIALFAVIVSFLASGKELKDYGIKDFKKSLQKITEPEYEDRYESKSGLPVDWEYDPQSTLDLFGIGKNKE